MSGAADVADLDPVLKETYAERRPMSEPKKKPALSLVIAMGKKGKDDGDEPDADDEDYSASVDELADVLGVGDDDRKAFSDAFKAAVMSCK